MAKNKPQAAKQDEPTGATEETTSTESTTQTEAPKETVNEGTKRTKLTPVNKITVKEVYGPVDQKKLPPLRIGVTDENPEGEPNPEPEIKVCRIAGFASGVKQGLSTFGPWFALTGEFAATSYGTGEMFASKTAIIPGAMGEALVTAVEEQLKEDADSRIRFSVDVFIKRSSRDPQKKYEYVVRPVIEANLSSPALELLGMS